MPKLGWTSAIKLRAGDILVLSNGEYVVVEAVQHEILESPIKVYNFEVEDFHTYFVGESSVLVHNRCTGDELASTSIKANNEKVNIGNNSKRQTPDQKALYDLAKEAERKAKNGHPISYEEAKILDEWALEYNVPQHHQAYPGSGEHFPGGNYADHTHIYNVHVPYTYD